MCTLGSCITGEIPDVVRVRTGDRGSYFKEGLNEVKLDRVPWAMPFIKQSLRYSELGREYNSKVR